MSGSSGPSPSIQLTSNPRSAPVANNFAAKADSIGLGGPKTEQAISSERTAAQALAGSNRDVVANRAAIRMANLSAAEMLKAEMASLMPVKRHALPPKPPVVVPTPTPVVEPVAIVPSTNDTSDMEVPGLGSANFNGDAPSSGKSDSVQSIQTGQSDFESRNGNGASAMEIDKRTDVAGVKRSFEEAEEDLAEDSIGEEEEDEDAPAKPLALKVNPDGTVEQEDTVRYVCIMPLVYSVFISYLVTCHADYGSQDIENAIIVRSLASSQPTPSSRSGTSKVLSAEPVSKHRRIY